STEYIIRSPDFTSLNFNLLSTQKNVVYIRKPCTQAQICFEIEIFFLAVPVENLDLV
ncbi:hypothetical protein C0J52_12534, partial [Blattella germanica]